jgi:hypothetical protein
MSTSVRTVLQRPLGRGLAALAGILAFSLIAGLVDAIAIVAGFEPHWAFALGWIFAFAALIARQAVRAAPDKRPWRVALVQLAFMGAMTVIVTWLVGARIFAAAR